jgi:hypothetical protein
MVLKMHRSLHKQGSPKCCDVAAHPCFSCFQPHPGLHWATKNCHILQLP